MLGKMTITEVDNGFIVETLRQVQAADTTTYTPGCHGTGAVKGPIRQVTMKSIRTGIGGLRQALDEYWDRDRDVVIED